MILIGPKTSWYPPGAHIPQPFYPRTINIVDLSQHSTDSRFRYWEKARNAARAMWEPGVTLRVSPSTIGYRPGFITLDVTQTQDGTRGQADFGRLEPDESGAQELAPGVAWVHVDTDWFEQQFLSGTSSSLKRVVAHELGHTLGFDHGGTGVMSTFATGAVNAEEIDALRAYWRT